MKGEKVKHLPSIIFVTEYPPVIRAFGLIGFLVGFVLVFEDWLVGASILILSVLTFLPKNKREICLESRHYREGLTLGKKSFSNWKKLPTPIDYISVMPVKKRGESNTTVVITAMSATNIYTEYLIHIIYQKRKRFKIFEAKSMVDAIEYGKLISKELKVDCLVVEAKKKYWLRN